MKKQREMNGILENYKRLKMMKTFGGKRPTTRLAMKAGPLENHLVCSAKENRFYSSTGIFSSKESHQTCILECCSWE